MIQKKILVPVNFDTKSEAALNYAAHIARLIDGMVTCLHIFEEPGSAKKKTLPKEYHNQSRREAEQKLAALINLIFVDKNMPFEIIVSEGIVRDKIIEKAADLNATFIIMGRSETHNLRKNSSGSNLSHVITHARIPVITLAGNRPDANGQILLPLDLSKSVESKVTKTIEIARILNADITVLAILSYDLPSRENKYKTSLNNIQEEFTKSGLTCNTKLLISRKSPAEEIINYANKTDTGMIVLMTQQERLLTDLFVGTTAREIIQNSGLPVMSIIPEAREPALDQFVNLNKKSI